MEGLKIRRANAADIDAIAEMEKLCFADAWSREAVASEFSGLNDSRYFAAEEDGELIGYAGVWIIRPEAYRTNIAVKPQHRRKGIGGLLLKALIREAEEDGAEEISLEVRVSNGAAIALYEAFGFETAGFRRAYYSNGEDAIIMWRGR